MSEQPKEGMKKPKKGKLYAAIFGAALGIGCHFAPIEYQDACKTVAKIVPLVCGIGG